MTSAVAMRGEWRNGWPVVMAAAGGMSVAPLILYTTGIFIEPLERAFGWSRAAINSGLTVNAVVAVLLSSFAGALIDRIGPRRIALTAIGLFCLFFGLLAANTGSLAFWWGLWLLISLSVLGLKTTVWVAAVASRFERARGLAVALTLSGSSITGIIAPLIAGWLVDSVGWRYAYVGIALIWGIVVTPLLLLFFYGAVDLNRKRAGATVAQAPMHLSGTPAREAFCSPNYIRLALACSCSYFAITGTIVNLVPMMVAGGIARTQASMLMSALGVSALAGRLFAGYWLDRYNPKLFGIMVFALPIAAFTILLGETLNVSLALAAAMLVGLASGAEYEIASVLISRYFGLRQFGILFGTIVGLLALVSGISPALFGFFYDQFGTYRPAVLLALPLSVAASLLIATLSRVPLPVGHSVAERN